MTGAPISKSTLDVWVAAPIRLWSELVHAIIFLLNRTPIRSLGWKTPYEMLYGNKPRLFGLMELITLKWMTTHAG